MEDNLIIKLKYDRYRLDAVDGDIILWKGNGLISNLIRKFDNFYINDDNIKIKNKAYYTHISFVHWHRDRLENCDAWTNGITNVPMSHRIKQYKDFCVLRPTNSSKIEYGIFKGLGDWESEIKYDYLKLLRLTIIKKFGIDITGLTNNSKQICSSFIQKYSENIGLNSYKFRKLLTPQDFIRFVNHGIYNNEIEILFNDTNI